MRIGRARRIWCISDSLPELPNEHRRSRRPPRRPRSQPHQVTGQGLCGRLLARLRDVLLAGDEVGLPSFADIAAVLLLQHKAACDGVPNAHFGRKMPGCGPSGVAPQPSPSRAHGVLAAPLCNSAQSDRSTPRGSRASVKKAKAATPSAKIPFSGEPRLQDLSLGDIWSVARAAANQSGPRPAPPLSPSRVSWIPPCAQRLGPHSLGHHLQNPHLGSLGELAPPIHRPMAPYVGRNIPRQGVGIGRRRRHRPSASRTAGRTDWGGRTDCSRRPAADQSSSRARDHRVRGVGADRDAASECAADLALWLKG